MMYVYIFVPLASPGIAGVLRCCVNIVNLTSSIVCPSFLRHALIVPLFSLTLILSVTNVTSAAIEREIYNPYVICIFIAIRTSNKGPSHKRIISRNKSCSRTLSYSISTSPRKGQPKDKITGPLKHTSHKLASPQSVLY